MKYGDVIGMDHIPQLRMMVIGPNAGRWMGRQPWDAVILYDLIAGPEWPSWMPGEIKTFDPLDRGITIIESAEGVE